MRRSFRKLTGHESAPKASVASRLAIEVVPGSFHKVAGIKAEDGPTDTIDGLSHGAIRIVELNLGANRKNRGFNVEQRYRPNSGTRNGLSFVVSQVRADSIVAVQRLLRDGDEVVAVNGLPLDNITRVQDVETLLGASDTLRLRIRCVSDTDDARYTPRRLSPVDHHSPVHPATLNGVRPQPVGAAEPQVVEPSPPSPLATTIDKPIAVDERHRSTRAMSSDDGDVFDRSDADRRRSSDPTRARPMTLSTNSESTDGSHSPKRPPPPAAHLIPSKPSAPRPPERRSSRSVRRSSSLRSAQRILGKQEGPPAPTMMMEMAHVFVDEKEKMAPDQRQQLLAECLAEEFNLPFFVDQMSSLQFDEV